MIFAVISEKEQNQVLQLSFVALLSFVPKFLSRLGLAFLLQE